MSHKEKQPKIKAVNTAALHSSKTMSHATKAGGFLFLSGVVAIDQNGAVIGAGDPGAQAEAVLDGIEAVLDEAGASFADVVRFTCFAVTREAATAYMTARAKRTSGQAAATTVFVSGLLLPELLLEVEVIALAPN